MMHYEVTEACFHHKDRNHRSSAVSQILLQRRCRPALGRPLAVKNNSHWLQDKSQERELLVWRTVLFCVLFVRRTAWEKLRTSLGVKSLNRLELYFRKSASYWYTQKCVSSGFNAFRNFLP